MRVNDRPGSEETPQDAGREATSEAEESSEAGSAPGDAEWERRRRRSRVFGDVLPETTGDEREDGDGGTSEEWLRRQVPPHHG